MNAKEELLHNALETLGDTIQWHRQGDPNANPPSYNALRVLLYQLTVPRDPFALKPPTKRQLQALRLTPKEWAEAMNEILDAGVLGTTPPEARFELVTRRTKAATAKSHRHTTQAEA